MKLIAGLGNPGRRYAGSRHNVGYLVVDELARRWQIDAACHDRRCEGLLAEGSAAGQRVLLLKPTTFMNLSGRNVAAVWRFYKLALADVLIVHDDLDLPVGQIRLRAIGSAGGHKGLLDILRHLGSPEVPRLRIGIGKVHQAATVEYVLSRFEPQERETIEQALPGGGCRRVLAARRNRRRHECVQSQMRTRTPEPGRRTPGYRRGTRR